MVFLYNTEIYFDTNGDPKVKEKDGIKWYLPIEAIEKIKMVEVKDKKIEFHMTLNAKCQDQILEKHKLPKVKKTERDIEYSTSRRTAARDFLWHITRIHDWWNFAKPSGG